MFVDQIPFLVYIIGFTLECGDLMWLLCYKENYFIIALLQLCE